MTHQHFSRVSSRYSVIVLAIVSVISVGLLAQVIPPQVKGDQVTLKGEIIDLYCFMHRESRGQGHRTCSTKCANMGNPIGFAESGSGEIYTLIGADDYQAQHPTRDLLIKNMNFVVTLSGTLVKKGNSQIVYVKTVEGPQ